MRKKNKKNAPSENRQKQTDPQRIKMARIFFLLNAILWLVYAVYIYYDMAVRNDNKSSADIATLFVVVNSGLLLFSGIKFGKLQKWTYYFALALVIFNAIWTLLNILDLYFLVFFILDLLILWIILPLRRNYFPKS